MDCASRALVRSRARSKSNSFISMLMGPPSASISVPCLSSLSSAIREDKRKVYNCYTRLENETKKNLLSYQDLPPNLLPQQSPVVGPWAGWCD